MWMFQSVSGHSSEQSTAHFSSRPTVSQYKGVSDAISNWFENHQPQRHQIPPSLTRLSVQNSNRMASRLTAIASFLSLFFSTPAIFKATFKVFGLIGFSDDKNWLELFSIFFILVSRTHDPSCLRQGSKALAWSNTVSPRFTDFPSNLANVIGWEY